MLELIDEVLESGVDDDRVVRVVVVVRGVEKCGGLTLFVGRCGKCCGEILLNGVVLVC